MRMPRRKRQVESDEESYFDDEGASTMNSENDAGGGDGGEDKFEHSGGEEKDNGSDESTTNKSQNSSKAVAIKTEESSETTSKRPSKKRKKKSYDAITPKDILPSYARKTKHGGYAHTNQSKGKISQANTGNTPWNKGKNRSSADRAKIAAGVRARNRTLLLEKLKRLGMSEEEWEAKRREIKYLRERVRRAKLGKKKHDASEAEMKLRAADAERKLQAAIDATTERQLDEKKATDKVSLLAEEVFSKDVVFTPFSFGDQCESYDKACPIGGPGGYICCEDCAEKYTSFVSGTVKDIEKHRATRNGREVQELLKFLKQGRRVLENAYNTAKKKIPPLPPNLPALKAPPKPAIASRKAAAAASVPTQWNMTSTFDIDNVKGSMTAI